MALVRLEGGAGALTAHAADMKAKNKNTYVKGNKGEFSESSGYFIGRFMGEKGHPELATDEVEVAWKKLPATFDEESPHFHKGGVEINVVVSGSYKVQIESEKIALKRGDFLVVYPETRLRNISAEAGTELIVIKAPSLPNDRFDGDR